MWGDMSRNEKYTIDAIRRLAKKYEKDRVLGMNAAFPAEMIHEEIVMSDTSHIPPSISTVRKILRDWAEDKNSAIVLRKMGRSKLYYERVAA
jgi:hypothetical protein